MQVIAIDSNSATIRLSNDDLVLLNNVFNEVCNGLDIADFETRIGRILEEAEQFFHGLKEVKWERQK